jgi:hypothetical protein
MDVNVIVPDEPEDDEPIEEPGPEDEPDEDEGSEVPV